MPRDEAQRGSEASPSPCGLVAGHRLVEVCSSDLAEVLKLVESVVAGDWVDHPADAARAASPERWIEILQTAAVVGVRTREGSLVAVSAWKISEGRAHLHATYVSDKRRGIGRALTRERLDRAASAGAAVAYAYVADWNVPSIENLRAAGFAITARQANTWGAGELLTMTLDLTPAG